MCKCAKIILWNTDEKRRRKMPREYCEFLISQNPTNDIEIGWLCEKIDKSIKNRNFLRK